MILAIIFFSHTAYGQYMKLKKGETEIRPLNNINYNIGEGSLNSINYERLYFINRGYFLAFQLGIGNNEEWQDDTNLSSPIKYTTIPHHITGNLGKGRNFFEFGLSGLIVTGNLDQHYLLGPILGYRLQSLKFKRVNFRIYVNFPINYLVLFTIPEILYLPIGASLGFCF